MVLNEAEHYATVTVAPDQQSLAIGRGGQNVRLAAKLTGWRLDIVSGEGETPVAVSEEADVLTETPSEINSQEDGGHANE